MGVSPLLTPGFCSRCFQLVQNPGGQRSVCWLRYLQLHSLGVQITLLCVAVHSCTAAQKTAEASAQRLPETERGRGEGDQRLPSHLPSSKPIFSFLIFFIEIDSSLIQYITTIISPRPVLPGPPTSFLPRSTSPSPFQKRTEP